MKKANEVTEESKTALAENVKTAREQEQIEQAERLEKARQEVDEKKAEAQADDVDNAKQTITNPVDTIEISPEAVAALQNEQNAATHDEGLSGVSVEQFYATHRKNRYVGTYSTA